jgi:hypothetical protein
MVSSSRDRITVSVETVPKNRRQDAAACVSLSISTMSKTRPPQRPRRLAPGGGEERRIYPLRFSVSTGFFKKSDLTNFASPSIPGFGEERLI